LHTVIIATVDCGWGATVGRWFLGSSRAIYAIPNRLGLECARSAPSAMGSNDMDRCEGDDLESKAPPHSYRLTRSLSMMGGLRACLCLSWPIEAHSRLLRMHFKMEVYADRRQQRHSSVILKVSKTRPWAQGPFAIHIKKRIAMISFQLI